MFIDLSVIPKDRPAAIVIPDMECAEVFLKEMKTNYPKKVTNWNRAEYHEGICYIPHFESNWGMTHWNVHRAREAGYAVVQWGEISTPQVLETGVSEYSIYMLLGEQNERPEAD